MTTTSRIIAAGLLVFSAPLTVYAQSAEQPSLCSLPFKTSALDRKLMDKSDQGVAALRNYVFITRGIYGLSLKEAADRASFARAEQRACAAAAVASAEQPRRSTGL